MPGEANHGAGKATCRIDVRREPDYLHIVIEGERTPETVRAMAKAIYAACTEHDCFRVLADSRKLTGRLNVVDLYYIPS